MPPLLRLSSLWPWLVCALLSLATPWAGAQVLRCTDARSGQVVYTNGPCPQGMATHEVEQRKSPEALQRERDLAEQAWARKREQQALDNDTALARARLEAEQERARAARAAAEKPHPTDYARSPECARARRLLEQASSGVYRSTQEQEHKIRSAQRQMDLDCLGPEGYAEVEKARAAQPRIVVPHRPAVLYPPVAPPTVFPGVGAAPPPRPVAPATPRYLTQCGDFRCTDNEGNTYPRTGPGRFSGPGGVCRSAGGQAPC